MGDSSEAVTPLLRISNPESRIPASNNSARGSCRLRSRAASFLEAGNIDRCSIGGRSRPGVGQPGISQTCVNQKTPEGRHHLRRPAPARGPIKRQCWIDGDSLPKRASMPVVDLRQPRLRSLTATAGSGLPAIAFKMSVTHILVTDHQSPGNPGPENYCATAGNAPGPEVPALSPITSATARTDQPSRPGPWSSSATPSAGSYPWRWPAWP